MTVSHSDRRSPASGAGTLVLPRVNGFAPPYAPDERGGVRNKPQIHIIISDRTDAIS